jgi:hypothetical protein
LRSRSIYAREGVRHVGIVEPETKPLEVLRFDGERYRLATVASEDVLAGLAS